MRTLAHSPADIVAQWLVNKGLATAPELWASGTGSDWPAFASAEPRKPDSVITVYDTMGTDAGRVMTSGEDQSEYGIQVRFRSITHPSGWQKANYVRAYLCEAQFASGGDTVVLEGSTYAVKNFANISHVTILGKEVPDEKTNVFTLNAVVNLDQTA